MQQLELKFLEPASQQLAQELVTVVVMGGQLVELAGARVYVERVSVARRLESTPKATESALAPR